MITFEDILETLLIVSPTRQFNYLELAELESHILLFRKVCSLFCIGPDIGGYFPVTGRVAQTFLCRL
jgi:hypothetical protein